ncbi:MAG TPA: hypothetical protein EYH11_06530, partial [Sulfurimonas autotrophica]|nr:hypothetical protein [Sulfurimonas autotrophica]
MVEMEELINGFKYFKEIQGTKYNKSRTDINTKLSQFRINWENFTNKIAHENNLHNIRNGIGKWLKANGTTIQEYLWNRYKPQKDDSNLVIYFNASSKNNEGIFVSIGLIDDKLTDIEKDNQEKIYDFLRAECSKIECNGFNKNKTEWDTGDRVFKISNTEDYLDADYKCLLSKLKEIYTKTYKQFYQSSSNNKVIEKDKKNMESKQPLNQILYGPPGTGKTYNTINKALEIIFEKEDDKKIIKHTFNDHLVEKSIEELHKIIKKE